MAPGRSLGLACGLAWLAACTPPAAPPQPPLGAPGDPPGTRFDGTYLGHFGRPEEQGGDGRNCPEIEGERQVTVTNGRFAIQVLLRRFDGPVGGDGSVALTGTVNRNTGLPGQISGRIASNGFAGRYSYPFSPRISCSYPMNGFARRN